MSEIIGVTGLPCSGKTHAARLLAAGGVTGRRGELILADDLGHVVLEKPEVLELLRGRFGGDIAAGAPADTRRRIAARVFANPGDLEWLESIVHPRVVAETAARIAGTAAGIPVVIEAALLFAAGMDSRCDFVLLIEADFAVRLARAEKRGWTREELERRDRRQSPLFESPPPHVDRNKIIPVRNDADDGRLGERIAAALAIQGKLTLQQAKQRKEES